jgi:hypothetical protein
MEDDGGNPVEARQERQELEAALAAEARGTGAAEQLAEVGFVPLPAEVEAFLQKFEVMAPAAEWNAAGGALRTTRGNQCPLMFVAGIPLGGVSAPTALASSLLFGDAHVVQMAMLGRPAAWLSSTWLVVDAADDGAGYIEHRPTRAAVVAIRARLLAAVGL